MTIMAFFLPVTYWSRKKDQNCSNISSHTVRGNLFDLTSSFTNKSNGYSLFNTCSAMGVFKLHIDDIF